MQGTQSQLLDGHRGIHDHSPLLLGFLLHRVVHRFLQQLVVGRLQLQAERPLVALAEIEEEQEEQVPDQRGHRGRAVILARLVEAQDVENLEGRGVEAVVRRLAVSLAMRGSKRDGNHAAESPRTVDEILREKGGLENEANEDDGRSGCETVKKKVQNPRHDVIEGIRDVNAEESRVAEIEQRDANADEIVAKNHVEQKQNREHFLQAAIRLPFIRELRLRALKHLQHAHRSVFIQLIEAFLHFLRIHQHAMRQHQVEPLDQLMHVEALLSLLRSENVHIVQLQRIPLHLPLTLSLSNPTINRR